MHVATSDCAGQNGSPGTIPASTSGHLQSSRSSDLFTDPGQLGYTQACGASAPVPSMAEFRQRGMDRRASSLSDFQRELRCVAERMDARRGAQPMALPLASVATQQTPFRRTTRRAGWAFGAPRNNKVNKIQKNPLNIH